MEWNENPVLCTFMKILLETSYCKKPKVGSQQLYNVLTVETVDLRRTIVYKTFGKQYLAFIFNSFIRLSGTFETPTHVR